LLERIKEEKTRLVEEGKIRKSKPLPPIKEDEIPYDLPDGWEWVRIGDITNHRLGKMLHKVKNKGNYFPYLRAANVYWNQVDISDIKEMRFEKHELDRYQVEKGDLLICEGGEAGRCAIWPYADLVMKYQNAIHRVRPFGSVSAKYIMFHIWGDSFSDKLLSYCTGVTIKHFTGKALASYIIGLPPLNEQYSVVEKVDSLLLSINQISAQLGELSVEHEKLVYAVLREV
jgi:type I restriction enzyme S subunit